MQNVLFRYNNLRQDLVDVEYAIRHREGIDRKQLCETRDAIKSEMAELCNCWMAHQRLIQ